MNSVDYSPILKWRPAELGALQELKSESKDRILPVIELVLPSPATMKDDKRTAEEKFESRYTKLHAAGFDDVPSQIHSAMGNRRVLLDIRLIGRLSSQLKGLNSILENGEALGLSITPVIGISDDELFHAHVFNNVNTFNHGLCIRLKSEDLDDIELLSNTLSAILNEVGLEPNQADIIVDTEDLEDIDSYTSVFLKAQTLPKLDEWQTFIFANGAFPVDLSSFKPTDPNMVKRQDWLRWQAFATKKLKRTPVFSDYTVRHPIYNEETLALSPSCSIKYTRDDEWQILKGYKHQYQYYLGYAVALVADDSFPGAEFSAGDKFFEDKSKQYEEIMRIFLKTGKAKGVGQNRDWIRACINHHVAQVLSQIGD